MAELPTYTSFYRRFRPQRFSEVLGQEHVTKALQNAVSQDRVSHAYLFSGPRGTGKTSTARILAKALNCLAPVDGEPCCECSSCLSITEGRSFDVVELDAASNSKVEDMRALVALAPTGTMGKWKVYIIDEVHMLSSAASNALLKTLEEPPSHVVFVLATTDAQKVIPTIKSRTQHYEFRFLDDGTLGELIESVKAKANLNLDEAALSWLTSKGGGSARDTLSYLDQIVALGYVPESRGDLEEVVRALGARNAQAVMSALDTALRSGRDSQKICNDLISIFRSGFLSSIGASDAESRIAEQPFSSKWLVNALSVLGRTLDSMKDSLDPRILLEVALIRLIGGDSDPEVAALSERIRALEHEISLIKVGKSHADTTDKKNEALAQSTEVSQNDRPQPRPAGPGGPAQVRERINEAPSHPHGRSRDTMDRLRSAISGAQSPGTSVGQAAPLTEDAGHKSDGPASVESSSSAAVESLPPSVANVSSEETQDMPPGAEPLGIGDINRVFKKEILPLLAGKARALFAAARVESVGSSRVVVSVPNEAHRSRALAKLSDVSQAIANFYSRTDLSVELISDEGLGHAPQSVPEPDNAAELIEQFSTAQEVATGGAESEILEIFPGAKKIES